MSDKLTLAQIEQQLYVTTAEFYECCTSISDEKFFHQPAGKWSPAQQVKHLITATNNSRLAFVLPKFFVRWYTGKPNRPSRTYDELVAKYNLKLEQGGKASKRYIPKEIKAGAGKDKVLETFIKAMHKLARTVKKWDDPRLDEYLAPHPLLGKITLRELCYFTIHHTYHHMESIEKMTSLS